MINIPNYLIQEIIYQGKSSLIFRAYDEITTRNVVIKLLNEEYPTPNQLARFQYEYEISKKLYQLEPEKMLRIYEIIKHNNSLALVVEDFSAKSLDRFLIKGPLELVDFLKKSIQLAELLELVHSHNILHKDINPTNILYNDKTGILKIIDFGISTTLSFENLESNTLNVLEGTLSYISPEQTGRMNRIVDYRSDYYSLGATFYEMVTGKPPFIRSNTLELIYAHIAKVPFAPHLIHAHIPLVVSDIIMKLLSKSPEDRYQSMYGLIKDLKKCLEYAEKGQPLIHFNIAQNDLPLYFNISEKLYGRKDEIALLTNSFEQSTLGFPQLILITGPAGSGKSILANELHKFIAEKRGYFVTSKCDQNKRNVPYGSLIAAIQKLLQLILTESPDEILEWKHQLQKAVGDNGKIIEDMIPEIKMIIGNQPDLQEIGLLESQRRFAYVFHNFVLALNNEKHPVTIFLDDIQWADTQTLQLLPLLAQSDQRQYLMVIATFREEFKDADKYSFSFMRDQLNLSQVPYRLLELFPLRLEDIEELLVDTFKIQSKAIQELAEVCLIKTGGNPLFLNQLLTSLHEDNLIYFDRTQDQWTWNLPLIQKKEIFENVIELMSKKISTLPEETQDILKMASCLGNHFELHTLASISEKSIDETSSKLWPALNLSLVIPENENYKFISEKMKELVFYHFAHDRIRQVVYDLIDESQKSLLHYQIGKKLFHNTFSDIEEKIFDILHHLNLGSQFIKTQDEKIQLAKLNFLAGKKAKSSSSFFSAVDYFEAAKQYLNEEAWVQFPALSFDILTELSGGLYLTGELYKAEGATQELLQRVKTPLEKAKILTHKSIIYITIGRMEEALEIALKGLEILGKKIPAKPTNMHFIKEFLLTKWNLGSKRISSLIDLQELTDPKEKLALELIQQGIVSTYFSSNTKLTGIFVLKQINIILTHGNDKSAALPFINYAVMLNIMNDLKSAYEFGKLALALSKRSQDIQTINRTLITYAQLIHGWNFHWKTIKEYCQKAIDAGLQTGDLMPLLIGSTYYLLSDPETPLDQIYKQRQKYLDLVAQSGYENALDTAYLLFQWRANLAGQTLGTFSLSDESFEENLALERMKKTHFTSGIAIFYLAKIIVHYHLDSFEEGLIFLKEGDQFAEGLLGLLLYTEYCFYAFLLLSSQYSTMSFWEKKRAYRRLKKEYQKFKLWSSHCPVNFLHQKLLLEAELERLCNNEDKAAQLYDQAIHDAKEQGFLKDLALTNELAGKFYLNLGKNKIAKLYFYDARYTYNKWGATSKIKQLEKRYPNFFSANLLFYPDISRPTVVRSETTTHLIDFLSIMKASQAITREIHLPKLIEKMMRIVVENAGAEKGFLIFEKEGDYFLEAFADTENVTILSSQPVTGLPISIIKHVAILKEPLVIGDAIHEEKYRSDPYIKQDQIKSILCYPLVYQGIVKGIIYLENNLARDVFTQEHLDVINLLSLQMVISIDNARSYEQLEERVEARTQALKEAQTRLILKEKMAYLGVLTTGIAHEIKNPLNFIINFSYLSQDLLKELENLLHQKKLKKKAQFLEISQNLSNLLKQTYHYGQNANIVVNRMIEHSSEKGQIFALTDIANTIQQALETATRQIIRKYPGFTIEIVKNIGSTNYIKISDIDIQRVITNLIDNSAYSTFQKKELLKDGYEPKIVISSIDKMDFLQISIKDNGQGIAPENLDKIFKPFFSTRPSNEGVGLGLSLCYNIIVEEHRGKLTFHSTYGEFTEFIITLPY